MKHAATAARVRADTRALVRSVDLRRLVPGTSGFSLYSCSITLPEALRLLPSTFPRLVCILLDGHADVEPDALVSSLTSEALRASNAEPPLLLSIPRCQVKLPTSFFASPYLKNLTYLDVSDLPGSLKNSTGQLAPSPANVPNLRILKVQGREMDDTTVILLFKTFKEQLWSVDLSRNKLTDGMFEGMHHFSFPAESVRTGDFSVEGSLTDPQGDGSASFGKFCFIKESEWSATFSHPHRYLADAPFYTKHAQDGLHGFSTSRLDGRVSIRPDSADRVKEALSGELGHRSPLLEGIHELDICQGHHGITHLYLNGNNISAAGLVKMIRSSPGQLQHLECDSVSCKIHDAAWRSWPFGKSRLSGILGSAHVFRPVISSNLQALRIHHSLVTQLLSLEIENMSTMANWWLAETCLLPRAELGYPESFLPDMNPRLQSLVLTQIPRYSTGPLIEKLINLLKLASIQERAIQEVKVADRRSPTLLLGLRHLRLEFQHDPREAFRDGSDDEDGLDPAATMDTFKEFSFFGDSGWTSTPSNPHKPPSAALVTINAPLSVPEPSTDTNDTTQSARLLHAPSTETTGTSTHSEHRTCTWTWNATKITVPVWIGPGHTPAVREYMRLLASDPRLHADPVPASPSHVAAGVPEGEYIFSAAWEAILIPPSPPTPAPAPALGIGTNPTGITGTTNSTPRPTRADLRSMRDVVAAIKAYRAQTRAAYAAARRAAAGKGEREVLLGEPHFHWTGRLEVSMADAMAEYHQSKYWR